VKPKTPRMTSEAQSHYVVEILHIIDPTGGARLSRAFSLILNSLPRLDMDELRRRPLGEIEKQGGGSDG